MGIWEKGWGYIETTVKIGKEKEKDWNMVLAPVGPQSGPPKENLVNNFVFFGIFLFFLFFGCGLRIILGFIYLLLEN